MATYKIKITEQTGRSYIAAYASVTQARKIVASYQAQYDRDGGRGCWAEYLGADAARNTPYCPRKASAAAAAGRR